MTGKTPDFRYKYPSVCTHCLKPFMALHKSQKFCGNECKNAARRIHIRGIRYCDCCGKQYKQPREIDRNNKFCSYRCRHEQSRRIRTEIDALVRIKKNWVPVVVVVCAQCGTAFVPLGVRNKYCSKECGYTAQINKQKKRLRRIWNSLPIINCAYCNSPFKPLNKRCTTFCSKKCCKRASKKIRKLLKRGASKIDKTIKPEHIFVRDMYMCGICGNPTNPNAHWLSMDAPTIDHITPLSKGGTHTWDNLQCACRICNSKKSDSLPKKIKRIAYRERASNAV